MEGSNLSSTQMDLIPFDLSNVKELKVNCQVKSHEELLELYNRWKQGDQKAFDQLVYSQLRLTLSIADKFRCARFRDDLRSEAIYALLYAIKVWDPKRGALSTIVTRIVRQRLTKYIEEHKYLIRLPLTLRINQRKKKYKKNLQPIYQMTYFPNEDEVPISQEDLDLILDFRQVEQLLSYLTKPDRALIYEYFEVANNKIGEILSQHLNLSKYKLRKRINNIINRLSKAGICYICETKFKPSSNSLNYCPKCWDMLSRVMKEWNLAVCPLCYKLFVPTAEFPETCSAVCAKIIAGLN